MSKKTNEETVSIKKNHILVGLAVLVVGALFAFGSFASGTTTTGNAITEGAQEVTLSMQGSSYILEPSNLQVNVPVVMTVDMDSVVGCMRDVVIPEFDVREYVSADDNVIEFTPTKEGTFAIVCSMNMGQGTFTVGNAESYDGTKTLSATKEHGSCGSGSCGCGA